MFWRGFFLAASLTISGLMIFLKPAISDPFYWGKPLAAFVWGVLVGWQIYDALRKREKDHE